jgi:RHS repeat-associated protein
VETKWGVPTYDKEFETETYLFNGEQLVPEAGESFVGDPSDTLHLVAMPHRTTNLRPRKRGDARFVLRRDDGLWRFVRRGSDPRDYWWEAWQERPDGGVARTRYFGRAPGRIPDAIEEAKNYSSVLRLGAATANPRPESILKWNIAREVDGHRNAIDYDWEHDCSGGVGCDLILRRIFYTTHLGIEETVLRCREDPTASSCRRDWALYEALFEWSSDGSYRRSDARSGGLVASSKLLSQIDIRGRQLRTMNLGHSPFEWSCSKPFRRYSFAYRGEFGASDQGAVENTDRGVGRAFLKSITKRIAGREEVFHKRDQIPQGGCDDASSNVWQNSFTNRFQYDLAGQRDWSDTSAMQAAFDNPQLFGVVNQVRGAFGVDRNQGGPASTSILGTTATSDASISFYGGLNLFHSGKTNSFGIKSHSSRRTDYRESSLLLDLDGDGISDLIVRESANSYRVYRGRIDANGHIQFANALQLSVPSGFAGFNREPFQQTHGSAVEAHMFHTFYGSMSSKTSALQDTYVVDVNGDGRPDVVSKGVVFFNVSANGNLAFSSAQRGAFIDPRTRVGLSGAQAASLLSAVKPDVPAQQDSEDAPRVDPVRVWRAPFSGDILIRGDLNYRPGPRPSDASEEGDDADQLVRAVRFADRRDGLIFTVELNRNRRWDGAGDVVRCFAHKFEKAGADRSVALHTQAPDNNVPVPVISCFDEVRPGWPTLPPLPPELNFDKGLRVSVEAGDILYFRIHSIDNAQDDILQFAPAIDYFRLSDDVPEIAPGQIRRSIVYGANAPANGPGLAAVLSSIQEQSSTCVSLRRLNQQLATEASLGLCDPWGRSMVRYRALQEADAFLEGNGMLISPIKGVLHFRGDLVKPHTPFSGEIAIRILPPPPIPDTSGNITGPNPGCAPEMESTPNTTLKRILEFGREGKSYPVSDERIFVERGQRICVFLRFWPPGDSADRTARRPIVWPQDMSGFIWEHGGLEAIFDRKLLAVELDRPDRNPDDLLTPADRNAPQAPTNECPQQAPAEIKIKVPEKDQDLNLPNTWTGEQVIYTHLRCVKVDIRRWVAPRSGVSQHSYFFAANSSLGAVKQARRLSKLKLPPSALACPSDTALREYRLRFDTRTLGQANPVLIDQDTRRPRAYNALNTGRAPIAAKRTIVTFMRNGAPELAPLRAFVVKVPGESHPRLITDGHLVDLFEPGAQKVDDINAKRSISTQLARRVPPPAGPGPVPPPDARTSFYVEIKEGNQTGPDDDGIRVYPSDRVGYSFCAPNEAEVDVASVVEPTGGPDQIADQLLASGPCASVCPIVGNFLQVARRSGATVTAITAEIPFFVPRKLPIEWESYRGWGYLAVTTEFSDRLPVDNNSIVESPSIPLSFDKAVTAESPEMLPTVRHFNRLMSRLKDRQGPLAGLSPDQARAEAGRGLHAGPCGATPSNECIRQKFLSQIRVHPMIGASRAGTGFESNEWGYCSEKSRPSTTPPDVGTPPHYCLIGPDVGVWISSGNASSSRLGPKDLANPVSEAIALEIASLSNEQDNSAGRLVRFLPKISRTSTEGKAASIWLGISSSKSDTLAKTDTFDLNGDGFPDQISGQQVFFSDPAGRLRCLSGEVWADKMFPCITDEGLKRTADPRSGTADFAECSRAERSAGTCKEFTRKSNGSASSLSIPFSSPKTFVMAATTAAARMGLSPSGAIPSQALEDRDPPCSGLSIGAEFSRGRSERGADLIDFNGDGLPDLFDGTSIQFNLGYGYASAMNWRQRPIVESSSSVGLSASIGYGTDNHEFCGGLSASTSRSLQTQTLADVNGDGLLDIVRLDGSKVKAKLNNGLGFADEIDVGGLPFTYGALAQGESDNLGANAYFTYSIPIWLVFWTIFIVVNPGVSVGANVNRQVIALRDLDADGLADIAVTGGVKVADRLQMMFDNRSATIHKNPFGTHGLLTHVYLPTNPQTTQDKPDPSKANYQISYARSAPSENDPQSRWVMSEVTVRDGVAIDDVSGASDRRSCHSYETGLFDRFERKFLGYARVVSVEACDTPHASRPKLQIDRLRQLDHAGAGVAASRRDSELLSGVRRIEQTYANGSIYEAGLLLSERTIDLSLPRLVAGASSPTRVVENTFALIDVARSSREKRECFALKLSGAYVVGADPEPTMRTMLTSAEGGVVTPPGVARDAGRVSDCRRIPDFDRDPRRLFPVLVQSVQTITESGAAAELPTAVQHEIDQLGRVVKTCDLGRLKTASDNNQPYRDDDTCASISYDDQIQLSFIHAATGGGTLAFDRRDRVKEITIHAWRSAPAGWVTHRRRTAAYERATGDMIAVCQFERLDALDLCSRVTGMPLDAASLRESSSSRVVVRYYRYDAFGNISRFLSPVSADGYYLSKRYAFDPLLNLVELSESTAYCKVGGSGSQGDLCVRGSTDEDARGIFVSRSDDIDWRHATATTQIDINRNAIHSVLDGAGRIMSVFATWPGLWARAPDCGAGECSSVSASELKPSVRWGQLLAFQYRVGGGTQAITSLARVTRYTDAATYRLTEQKHTSSGVVAFESDHHVDQLGHPVRTISPADVCLPGAETPDGAVCDPLTRATHVASGIVKRDAAFREVESFLPVSLAKLPPLDAATAGPLSTAVAGRAPGVEDFSAAARTKTIPDGFDRPLHVRLLDGNGYAFKYEVTRGDGDVWRHRTVFRDARCVPTSMDRDERGLIRAVHEFRNVGGGFSSQATGSSAEPTQEIAILAQGWVRDINFVQSHQQTMSCMQGEADEGAGLPISQPLQSPFGSASAQKRRNSTLYEYDSLNQLIAVFLPKPQAEQLTSPVSASDNAIRAVYDALGRRIAIDDPDRGFEHFSHDLASNVVCRRSGARSTSPGALQAKLDAFLGERRRAAAGADTRIRYEDACLSPADDAVTRVVRQEYLYDLPRRVIYRSPSPIDRDRKTVAIEYGKSSDFANNRSGRRIGIADVTGTSTIETYHPLGLALRHVKRLAGMARGGAAPSAIGQLSVVERYDAWGVLNESRLTGSFSGLKEDGSNDAAAARGTTVDELVRYRYSPAGQVSEVHAGPACPAGPDGRQECRNISPPIKIVADAAFDERSNLRRLVYGHGVVTRNEFDEKSNRLLRSYSKIGVKCVEFGPGDDCSTSAPPILFQNVSYRYDAAGLLTRYDNKPGYAFDCSRAADSCPPIGKAHAGAHGLLITSSGNAMAYDERARVKGVQKELIAYGRSRQGVSWLVDDDEEFKERGRSVRIDVSEEFAFSDSHLLTGIRRATERRYVGDDRPGSRVTTIRHQYSAGRPNAPDATNQSGPHDDRQYGHDTFGRLSSETCEACISRRLPDEQQLEFRDYRWDPDDTLVRVVRRLDPPNTDTPEDQLTDEERNTSYFNRVEQTYDYAGNRAIKRLSTLKRRPDNSTDDRLERETVYADARLTILREPGEKAQALLHIFSGNDRVASKWVGGEGLFTYHAQLATGNISDVVYARGDNPTRARLHQQLEYAAFGELLLSREWEIARANRSPVDRARLATPHYRFNAKELDEESGLTYFGARFYDQRQGLWLNPDPIVGSYLEGEPAGGIFAPKNLAAYSFGWGNPIGFRDINGQFVNFVIGGIESAGVGAGLQLLEMSVGLRDEFSVSQIGVDFALGFATSGISSVTKIARVGELTTHIVTAAKQPSRASQVQRLLGDIATRSEKIHERLARGRVAERGTEIGIEKHKIAERLLKRHQSRTGEFAELKTEISFGSQVGTKGYSKGSSRLDVYDPVDSIAYDYKFSIEGGIGRTQHLRNMKNVPGLLDTVPIVPNSWFKGVQVD